jgi:hypothetical protein
MDEFYNYEFGRSITEPINLNFD